MAKKNSQNNLICHALVVPYSNKSPYPERIVQDRLTSITEPSDSPIVDPRLSSVTGVSVDQEVKDEF